MPTRHRRRCPSRHSPPLPIRTPFGPTAPEAAGAARLPATQPPTTNHEETTMPHDSFTLGLFDTTALSGWGPARDRQRRSAFMTTKTMMTRRLLLRLPRRRFRAAAISISRPTARLPPAGRPGRATTSTAILPVEGAGGVRPGADTGGAGAACCASSASARPSWRRIASAAPARPTFAPAGRRSARRSKRR